MTLNEYEVERLRETYRHDAPEYPNLWSAIETLENLIRWTNRNSDGWPYWRKPGRASARLQDLIHECDHNQWFRGVYEDIPLADLRKAFAPIKAFRTRCNNEGKVADFAIILPGGTVE